MARYLYAATPADYVVNASTGLPVPNAVVTVWNARTGGSQVTDLQTLAGGTITQVTADSQGYIAFYGPDNMTDLLWIYAGSGPRLAVRAATDFALKAAPLPLSGGTMTGPLVLSGAPTLNLHAATKQYVDTNVANFLAKTGDTMSGSLRVNQASVKVTGDASTYTFERRQGDGTGYGFRLGATSTLPLTATLYDAGGNTLSAALSYSTSSSRWNLVGNLDLGGSYKVTGLAAATANGEAVRFEQLDSQVYQNWSPLIAADTTNPSTFVFSAESRYIKIGRRVAGKAVVQISGGAYGSGNYRIPLPVAPAVVGEVSADGVSRRIGDLKLCAVSGAGVKYVQFFSVEQIPIYAYCQSVSNSSVSAVQVVLSASVVSSFASSAGATSGVFVSWDFDYEAAS